MQAMEKTERKGRTMSEALADGTLFTARLPGWADGLQATWCGTPEEAARSVEEIFARYGWGAPPPMTKIDRALSWDVWEPLGMFPTTGAGLPPTRLVIQYLKDGLWEDWAEVFPEDEDKERRYVDLLNSDWYVTPGRERPLYRLTTETRKEA